MRWVASACPPLSRQWPLKGAGGSNSSHGKLKTMHAERLWFVPASGRGTRALSNIVKLQYRMDPTPPKCKRTIFMFCFSFSLISNRHLATPRTQEVQLAPTYHSESTQIAPRLLPWTPCCQGYLAKVTLTRLHSRGYAARCTQPTVLALRGSNGVA